MADVSPRIVVLDSNIAMEDVPGRQAFLAGALPSPGSVSNHRRSLRSLYYLCRSLGSLRSLYNLGLVVRRAGVFLRSPCRLAEGEDHAAAGSADHSQELGGLG